MKRNYKIKFERLEHCVAYLKVETVYSGYLISKIKGFCNEKNIMLKKLVIGNYCSYVKIRGSKEDYDSIIFYRTSGDMRKHIELKKVY